MIKVYHYGAYYKYTSSTLRYITVKPSFMFYKVDAHPLLTVHIFPPLPHQLTTLSIGFPLCGLPPTIFVFLLLRILFFGAEFPPSLGECLLFFVSSANLWHKKCKSIIGMFAMLHVNTGCPLRDQPVHIQHLVSD